jgi:hypothetical protein
MPWSASRLEARVLGLGFKSILIDDSSPSLAGAAMNRQGLQRAKDAGYAEFHRAEIGTFDENRYRAIIPVSSLAATHSVILSNIQMQV